MIRLGLTGSIGMGKSTTAAMFAEEGVPVHDSDRAVHELYAGDAVAPVAEIFPEVIVNGRVDRELLSRNLAKNPANFKALEKIIHPLVRHHAAKFEADSRSEGADLVLFDIPLLFETGGEKRVDKIVVVTCDPEIQRQRVLARPGVTNEKFDLILARQVPDAEKRARADYVVDTSEGLEEARRQVRTILADLKKARGD